MTRELIEPKGLPATKGPYSQVAVGRGERLVFISGQVPLDAQGRLVGAGDVAAQTNQVMSNVKAAMEAAGGGMDDICKITIFVVGLDQGALKAIAQARQEFFKNGYPASSLVEVKRLVSPDWLIEIEALAVI